jgi:hypothetical protein
MEGYSLEPGGPPSEAKPRHEFRGIAGTLNLTVSKNVSTIGLQIDRIHGSK